MYLDVVDLKRKSFFRETRIVWNENSPEFKNWEKKEVLLVTFKEKRNVQVGKDSQDSRGNCGVIYWGVALDKFISISMENTLDTHNAAKPRARM